jgi:ketosteroid isomerase-like protein
MNIKEAAINFFAAIERGDMKVIEEMYADDLQVWHNFTGLYQNKWDNLNLLDRLGKFESIKYNPDEIIELDGRLIQRHVLVLTEDGGRVHRVPGVIFLTFHNGKIVNIYEYIDSKHLQDVFAYMG